MKTTPRKKIPVTEPILRTWIRLNDYVRKASEVECEELLKVERAGRRRKMFILRIHSRLNRLRRERERKELTR